MCERDLSLQNPPRIRVATAIELSDKNGRLGRVRTVDLLRIREAL